MQYQFYKGRGQATGGVMLAMSVLLTLGGCSNSSTPPEENAMTDQQLQRVVKREITDDERLPVNEIGVLADAENHEVVLDGMVPTDWMRERAVEVVRESDPNLLVVDNIEVVPVDVASKDYTEDLATTMRQHAAAAGEKVGETLDDAWIYSSILARLALDNDTPARDIRVDVEDEHVTLRGTVMGDYAKSEAERIAKNTQGVKSVDNQIQVAD